MQLFRDARAPDLIGIIPQQKIAEGCELAEIIAEDSSVDRCFQAGVIQCSVSQLT